MKKFLIILLGIVAIVLVTDFIIMPRIDIMRGSPDRIRDYILTLTPIGARWEDVEELVENTEDWRIMSRSRRRGGVVVRGRQIPGWPVTPGGQSIVGEGSITVDTGSYRALRRLLILEVGIVVEWAFDWDGNLIDVFVGKFFML